MTESTPTPADDVTVVGAVSDGLYTLIVADFADTASAMDAYEELKSLEDGRTIEVEGAIVVSRAMDGTLTVQQATSHTTGRGATWGAVGGAVLGLLFPPAILGSAVAAGIVGAAIGKGVAVHNKHKLAEQLQETIDPGHSGFVALVSDPAAVEIAKALAKANRVIQRAVDSAVAEDVKAAARQAEKEAEVS